MSAKQFKAPDWDGPFEPQKQWGELAGSIGELPQLIEETAEVFREGVPKSKKEIISIEQSTGLLKIHIRGGVRRHSDCDMWVTKKTLPLVMRILYSIGAFKLQLENLTSEEKARDLYHKVINAFRYVYEPEKPDSEGHISKTSGDYALPGSEVRSPAIKAKNVFRRFGYVFVGDEPREKYRNYVDEILATFNLSKPQKNGRQIPPAPDGEWSRILPKIEIVTALGLSNVPKLNTLAEEGIYEIRQAGKKREDWQIRIDKLPTRQQKKLK